MNPRDRKQLEHYLTVASYPPFDIEWADVAFKAMDAIDAGDPEEWIETITKGYQLTATDTLRFLGIKNAFQNLTVADSNTTTKRKR